MSKSASAGQRWRNVRDLIGMLTNQVFRDGKVEMGEGSVWGSAPGSRLEFQRVL